MKINKIWSSFIPILGLSFFLSIFDVIVFQGMCLAAAVVLMAVLFFPMLIWKNKRFDACKILMASILISCFDLIGGRIINQKIISAAYQFRSAIISERAVDHGSALKSKNSFLGYAMIYIAFDDKNSYINISQFNYQRRLLNINTGYLSPSRADD